MEEISCSHCGKYFTPDHRHQNPTHCGEAGCQRARKALWQREKMRHDPVYKADQRRCGEDWRKSHPGYWKEYRESHPGYASRNRDLQRVRNRKRHTSTAVVQAAPGMGVITKMDALKVNMYQITGC
jgi:hypothetical protein